MSEEYTSIQKLKSHFSMESPDISTELVKLIYLMSDRIVDYISMYRLSMSYIEKRHTGARSIFIC